MTRVSAVIREQVRTRAGERCEYCRMFEAYSQRSYHVDHILPVKRHRGSPGMENLAWACTRCNIHKSSDIASYDSITNDLTPFYNPRTQDWDIHFKVEGALIVGKTSIGRVTVRLLQMNTQHQVDTRQLLIDMDAW
jgi:hypothetical protein